MASTTRPASDADVGRGTAGGGRPTSADGLPRWVRAWYGLPGEIVIEGDTWHLVKVGPLPLPHPPLVNRVIRRGLPAEARLRLSYWHELGHLQTLPVALAHAVCLWRRGFGRPATGRLRLLRASLAFLTHEALWELAAEGYVVTRAGRDYSRLYRRHGARLLGVFWAAMAAIVLLEVVTNSERVSRGGRGEPGLPDRR